MTGVKICGLTREEDICFVNKYLPEYVGFVFAKSKRQIVVDRAEALTKRLDDRIKPVGVFVNEGLAKVVEIAHRCRLHAVQIHGDETPEYLDKLTIELKKSQALFYMPPVEVWKAVRVKDMDSIRLLQNYSADAFVLDAFVEGSYGGAGKVFDWKLAIEAERYGRIIVAGGLDESNVNEAVRLAQPYAVDVSSGVERNGFKDEEKIKGFINTVRGY